MSEKENNTNDLFIKDSENSDESSNDNNVNFSSSESDEESVNKSEIIKKNIKTNKQEIEGISATNGINLIDNILEDRPGNLQVNTHFDSSDSEKSSSDNSSLSDNKTPSTDSNKRPAESIVKHKPQAEINKSMFDNMLKPNNINGWDVEANTTLKNWYHTFKQQSFIYQTVLDHNNLMAERLAFASIATSSTLGIFAGFKLWIPDSTFQIVSNIILILCNFGVALITAMSRRYGDIKRTDLIGIKNHVDEIDEFLGIISAQVLKSPIYRTNADDFFRAYNDQYTKIITSAPNISLGEITKAKNLYEVNFQVINNIPV
jgi:hypothetical protein